MNANTLLSVLVTHMKTLEFVFFPIGEKLISFIYWMKRKSVSFSLCLDLVSMKDQTINANCFFTVLSTYSQHFMLRVFVIGGKWLQLYFLSVNKNSSHFHFVWTRFEWIVQNSTSIPSQWSCWHIHKDLSSSGVIDKKYSIFFSFIQYSKYEENDFIFSLFGFGLDKRPNNRFCHTFDWTVDMSTKFHVPTVFSLERNWFNFIFSLWKKLISFSVCLHSVGWNIKKRMPTDFWVFLSHTWNFWFVFFPIGDKLIPLYFLHILNEEKIDLIISLFGFGFDERPNNQRQLLFHCSVNIFPTFHVESLCHWWEMTSTLFSQCQ